MKSSFLDELKLVGNVCPICNGRVSISLVLRTDFNTHNYLLTNNEYPLKFSRAVPLGDQPETISMDENDEASLPIGTTEARIVSSCGEHYKGVFMTIFLGAKTKLKAVSFGWDGPLGIMEEIKIDDFSIQNFGGTSGVGPYTVVSKMIYSPHLWPFAYKKLFSMPLKPFSFWPLKNQKEFIEKIEKLLLLI